MKIIPHTEDKESWIDWGIKKEYDFLRGLMDSIS